MKSYHDAEEIRLVYSGANFFDVLERLIDECTQVLHFQTYIFNCDETGMRVIASLLRARQRNVEVFFMVDAYGSLPFPSEIAEELRSAGIHFRLFSPLFTSESLYVGRRLHHKVVVADKHTGLVGGINIADKYDTTVDAEAWLDYAVLCRGHVCEYLHVLCNQFYFKRGAKQVRRWERMQPRPLPGNKNKIRFRRNDWLKQQNEIHHSYISHIVEAKDSVFIVASYFLPGRTFRRLLRNAASRGVNITIIMAGTSDSSTLRLAERFLYDFYLRYNIQLFEWSNSVMHGKAMVVDDKWATIGSYNLNFLSHYVSIELNADILDPGFIQSFSAHLRDLTQTCCIKIETKKGHRSAGVFRQFAMWLAYNFLRLLSGLALSGKRYRKRLQQV
jgi:cardiolipin synthase A/B